MAIERMSGSEKNSEKPLESLNSEEILSKYKDKIGDKTKAERYLNDLNEKTLTSGSHAEYKSHDGVPVQFISKEVLRYINDNNKNIEFGPNAKLSDLPKEEAYAYIAYVQDMLGLEVDGLAGKKTKDKLASINKARVALNVQKAKDRQWLMARIDEELAKEKGAKLPKRPVVSIPEIKKSEGAIAAENFKVETPELKGVSREKLVKELRTAENQAEYRRVKDKIPKLMAKYDMQIEGGTEDLVKRAKNEKAKLEKVMAILSDKDFDKGLTAGTISFEDAMLLMGIVAPEDL